MTENEKNALRREGFIEGAKYSAGCTWSDGSINAAARLVFPDRTLRRVPDPDPLMRWVWGWNPEKGIPEAFDSVGCLWRNPSLAFTPERWAIWKSLEANPWEPAP